MAEDESADDYEDSDLSDFIVHTDEDEDEKCWFGVGPLISWQYRVY